MDIHSKITTYCTSKAHLKVIHFSHSMPSFYSKPPWAATTASSLKKQWDEKAETPCPTAGYRENVTLLPSNLKENKGGQHCGHCGKYTKKSIERNGEYLASRYEKQWPCLHLIIRVPETQSSKSKALHFLTSRSWSQLREKSKIEFDGEYWVVFVVVFFSFSALKCISLSPEFLFGRVLWGRTVSHSSSIGQTLHPPEAQDPPSCPDRSAGLHS